jgi:hypothetical protein
MDCDAAASEPAAMKRRATAPESTAVKPATAESAASAAAKATASTTTETTATAATMADLSRQTVGCVFH